MSRSASPWQAQNHNFAIVDKSVDEWISLLSFSGITPHDCLWISCLTSR
jgi:hypothetical protein